MRVAIFSDTYKPQINGVVTVINTLKEGLETRGHRVVVFTVSHPDAIPEQGVYRIKSVKFPKEPQHRMVLFPDPRLVQWVRSERVDVVHSHTPFFMGHSAVLIAKILRLPVLHTFHTYFEEYRHYLGPLKVLMTKKLLGFMTKNFCNMHDAIIAPSEKIRRVLKGYGVRVPVELVPNGVDLHRFWRDFPESEKFSFMNKFGISEKDKVLIFVGRMAREKSVDKVIENFARVRKEFDDVKLLLVGGGPMMEEYEELSRKLGVGKDVIFTGYLRWPDEVALAYKISHVFVSASHTEVHPVTFIEAIASGLPVVAYDDPSLFEVVENGVNGFLFTDKDELHVGIAKLLENEDVRKEFSKRSMEISKNFSAERFVERMEDVYGFYVHKKELMKKGTLL